MGHRADETICREHNAASGRSVSKSGDRQDCRLSSILTGPRRQPVPGYADLATSFGGLCRTCRFRAHSACESCWCPVDGEPFSTKTRDRVCRNRCEFAATVDCKVQVVSISYISCSLRDGGSVDCTG